MSLVKASGLAAVCLLLAFLPIRTSTQAAGDPIAAPGVSAEDRAIGARAAQMAAHGPSAALHWLAGRRAVAHSALGADGVTIEVVFRDGAAIGILPRPSLSERHRAAWPIHRALPAEWAAADPAQGRAVVLEPFASELGLGAEAGQDEANILSRQGFHVDILRNAAVTVAAMSTLSQYSFVYFQTHAGLLPNGDAVVATGETDTAPYATLFQDHSLMQVFVAGDPTKTLYDAVTSNFVTYHLNTFPSHSILFLNGCAVLGAPLFWQALQEKNADALISWDADVDASVNEAAGAFVLDRLGAGDTVSADIANAAVAGEGISVSGQQVAHLGYLGDGSDTLEAALSGLAPRPTVSSTASPTPVPTATAAPTRTLLPTPTPTIASTTPPCGNAHSGPYRCSRVSEGVGGTGGRSLELRFTTGHDTAPALVTTQYQPVRAYSNRRATAKRKEDGIRL